MQSQSLVLGSGSRPESSCAFDTQPTQRTSQGLTILWRAHPRTASPLLISSVSEKRLVPSFPARKCQTPKLRPGPNAVGSQGARSRPGPAANLLSYKRTPFTSGPQFPHWSKKKRPYSIFQLRPSMIVTCSSKATLWNHDPHFTDEENESLKG